MLWYGLVEFRRGVQATRGLKPGQRPAELLGKLRPGLQNGGKVRLCKLVDGSRDQCAQLRVRGRPGQQPDLSIMVPRPEAHQFDLALDSLASERQDAATDDKQRLQNDAGL